MKTILMFLLVGMFSVSAASYSQSQKVSVNMKNKTVNELFSEIKEQTSYSFWYDVNDVDEDKVVSVNAKDKSVKEVLETVLDDKNLEISVTGNHIVISKKQAQNQSAAANDKRTIKGQIVDSNGETVIGASITEDGVVNGVTSDIDGNFTLTVTTGKSITVSYIGYRTVSIPLSPNKDTYDIILQEDTKLLDEVVVVGYGTMEKRQVTSSISSIKGGDLAQGLTGATIGTVLRGKISGLSVSGTDSPNSETKFQLRGLASINASKGPLIVIDGVPGGDFRALNQEDIESIDVLKDASAGAIYGTRATGGVILITTKQAKEGPMKISYTGELMVETTRKQLEMLSASEFVEAGLGKDYGYDTNWFDEITRTPVTNRHVLTMSGGSKNSRVYSSFSYQDMQGLSIGDSRKDYSGRINTDFRFFDNLLEIKTHTTYRNVDRDEGYAYPNVRDKSSNIFEMGLLLNPTDTPYDDTNITGYNIMPGSGLQYNPLAHVKLRSAKSNNKFLTTDGTAKVNILPELFVQGTIGYQSVTTQSHEYFSANHRKSVDSNIAGEGYHSYRKSERISAEGYVNYTKTFADLHNVNVVVGHSFEEINGENFNMTNGDFPVDNTAIWDMKAGLWLKEGKASMNSSKDARERLSSFFGRANYSFDDKYMATGSLRREGSSKFGPNNKWGTFWSLSGGWRISKEKFMDNLEFISDLKARAGYGVVGNNGFTAGLSVPMYSSDAWWNLGGTNVLGYGARRNVNPDLKWEESKGWNFGLDYSLFNDRIYGKFDYYIREVEGMIYDILVPQPPNTHKTTLMNGGDLENIGWEFEIGANIVETKDWSYSTTLRLSQNTTTLKNLGGSATFKDMKSFPAPGIPGTAVRLEAGRKIGEFFIFKHAGFDENGDYLIYDKNNNVIPAKERKIEDKRYMGNALPKLIIAWDHTLRYKNWDMTVYMRSHLGQDVYNMTEMYYGVPNIAGQNVIKDAYEKNKHIKGDKQLTDYYLEDGSFFKIDAINIGYNLDLRKYHKHLGTARIYGSIRDVLCITNYSGLDPEVYSMELEPGFDDHRTYYPKMRRFTIGVQLNF